MEHVYVATASHVVNQGCTTLRVTQINGEVEFLELPNKVRNSFDPADGDSWIWNDEGNDVAVYPLEFPNRKYYTIPLNAFVTTSSQWGDMETHLGVEIGDELFMPGRLLTLDCPNPPLVVRFGRLASSEIIAVTNESVLGPQDSYLAELRTESGYSGAPVFIAKPALAPTPGQESVALRDKAWFLGLNWGHLPHHDRIVEKGDHKKQSPDWCVMSNSGIANIVPAWKLFQVLHYDELVVQRRNVWSTYKKALESGVQGVPDLIS
jgi:hypothetical protein